jgi:hypothetical protein
MISGFCRFFSGNRNFSRNPPPAAKPTGPANIPGKAGLD